MPASAVAVLRPPLSDCQPSVPRKTVAAVVAAGGLAISAVAGGLALSHHGVAARPEPVPAAAAAAAAAAGAPGPLAITLSGPGDVTVLRQVYEPGGDSGWHRHPGIHAVAVLSGTLTVHDDRCQPHTFGPGDSYIGGQEAHRVQNMTGEPVEMVVTYLNPAGPHDSNRQVPPPGACDQA